jgi:hypothetical protein
MVVSKNTTFFSLGTIVNTANFDNNGTFWAVLDALGNDAFPVNYTSPYTSRTEGAIIAIPEEGSRVMVCSPQASTELFYVGSTFLPDDPQIANPETSNKAIGDSAEPKEPIQRVEPNLYRMQGKPMKLCFRGTRGSGLSISEEFEGPKPMQANIKTELVGQSGKKMSIVDSPGVDSIILKNEFGDGIRISTHPKDMGVCSQAITVQSRGPQQYINKEGQTDIMIKDGRDLNITNESTGFNRNPDEPDRYGNINIETKTNDVNIMSRKDEGRIFIQCIDPEGDNQVIDIETKGGTSSVIRIKSTGKVEVISDGNMDLVSGGEINMKAAGDVNIESGGQISLKSSGNVNVDGSKTYLQTGTSNSSNDDVSQTLTSYYSQGVYP